MKKIGAGLRLSLACALIAGSARIPAQQAPSVSASQPPTTPAALSEAAIKAYQAKDYQSFLALEKRAMEMAPGTPRFRYNVACGQALTGHANEAVQELEALLDLKLDLGAETDDDFAGIHNTQEWAAFLPKLAELRKPVLRGKLAFRLDDPGLVAAGIAVNPKNGDTYIASIRERKILRRTRSGVVSDFIPEGKDGFLAGASLAIDTAHNLIIASTSSAPFMVGYQKEDSGRSGVFAFDLSSGKLVRKAMLANDGKTHFLNALAVARKGTVYVADSAVGEIFVLKPGSDALELLVAPGVFQATQGLALSENEKTLFVADYIDGLWGLDLETSERHRIQGPADFWLGGLDGLSTVADGFISVQIGVQPNRVLLLKTDPGRHRITSVKILESNRPEFNGPIQGAMDGRSFIYVANSQLGLVNGATGAFALEKAHPTVVLSLPL
jgi:sugar lactone lactonase YvrE